MPRSFFRDSVLVKGPAGTIPLAGAAVSFYLPAAPGSPATPISFPLYRGRDDPDPMVLPYVTGDLGELEVWADAPHRIRIIAAKSGLVSADETIDLEAEPDLGATDEDITDALAAHEADLDPHDQYLTQPEGNLLYLPLAHQPGTDPHPQYLQTTIFGQPDPLGQYQLETEKAQPSGYAPLDPGGLIPTVHLPPLAITNTFVVASEAEMLALVAQTGDLAIRSDTGKSYILAADPASLLTNWKELSAAAPVLSVDGRVGVVDLSDRYVDVGGDTLTGLLTTTFGPLKTSATAGNRVTWVGDGLFVPPALDQAAADLRYLQLSGGALTGPLSIQSKPVAVSPDAGNILQWLPNGFFAGLSTANVTVLKREEFSPPGSASSVTLAASPNTVLEVSRNGVAQSQALGHYTLLGAVITFADTFAAGEQVLVLYEVGTSQPVDAYTKAQSDARYLLLTGGAVTGATTFAAAPTVGGSPLLTQTAGDARYPLKTDVDPYPVYYNQARGDARYLQTATAATTYLPLAGGTLTGVLRVNANVGVGAAPAAWGASKRVVQVGAVGAIASDNASLDMALGQNWYHDGTDNRAIVAAASALYIQTAGNHYWFSAPPVGAGAVQPHAQRMNLSPTGTLNLFPDASYHGLSVMGGLGIEAWTISAKPPSSELRSYDRGPGLATNYSSWYRENGSFLVWNSVGAKSSFNIAGNGMAYFNPDAGVGAITAQGSVNSFSSTAGFQFGSRDATGPNGYLWYAAGGYARLYDATSGREVITISPTGIVILNTTNGQPSMTFVVGSTEIGRITPNAGVAKMQWEAGGGGHDWFVAGTSWMQLNGTALYPPTSGSRDLGWPNGRWGTLFSVNAVNVSSREEKDDRGLLDPEAALAEVLRVPVHRFTYKRRVREFTDAKSREMAAATKVYDEYERIGFMAEEAAIPAGDALLLVGPDGVDPQNTAGVLMAAMQALAAQVADLKARLA